MVNKPFSKVNILKIFVSKAIPSLTLLVSIFTYYKLESISDKRITEYQKIVFQTKVKHCTELSVEAPIIIYQTLLFITFDSVSLGDSITSFNNRFNKVAFSGYPNFSDSLVFAIESFNTTLKAIKDSVDHWKEIHAISQSSLPYLFNRSPIKEKFEKDVEKLFLNIRKEAGGKELSDNISQLIHSN